MEQEQEQPVVEENTDTQAAPETEVADARKDGDDLDQLLSEFDASEPAVSTPEPSVAESELQKRIETLEGNIAQQQYKSDIKGIVNDVRGDLDPDVFDDATIEGLIHAEANRDPRLDKAWRERNENPTRFNKAVAGLGKRIGDKFSSMPDRDATEDREAVTQAVRGASTKAPDSGLAPDYGKMSDAEFRKSISKDHGYTPL